MDTTPTQETSKGSQSKVVLAIILVLIIVAAAYVYSTKSKKTMTAASTTSITKMQKTSPSMSPSASPSGMMNKNAGVMDMKPQPTPTLSAEQTTQLADELSTTSTEKIFTIDGGNFYFTPNEIKVNKGDTVTVKFVNDGGFHNFILDEFNVKTKTIKTGETDSVQFNADKVGTFEFYCGVGKHRQLGMKGTIVVQ